MNKEKKAPLLEELTISPIKDEDLILFDQTDKPFLVAYLIIFILGIFMTLAAI
jgi:hypothetical protein